MRLGRTRCKRIWLIEAELTNNDTAVRDFAALHLQPKSTAAADNEDIENAGRTASGQGRSTSITPGPGKPNDQIPYPLVRAPGVALPKDRPLTPIEIKTLRLCAQLRAQRAEVSQLGVPSLGLVAYLPEP